MHCSSSCSREGPSVVPLKGTNLPTVILDLRSEIELVHAVWTPPVAFDDCNSTPLN